MTISFAKQDKAQSLALLEENFKRFLYSGMKPTDIALVAQHLNWMHHQAGNMNVNAKLETVPELRMTRLTLEFACVPIPTANRPEH
jgi:hypothetical protein